MSTICTTRPLYMYRCSRASLAWLVQADLTGTSLAALVENSQRQQHLLPRVCIHATLPDVLEVFSAVASVG